jgi:predicted membrane protein
MLFGSTRHCKMWIQLACGAIIWVIGSSIILGLVFGIAYNMFSKLFFPTMKIVVTILYEGLHMA